MPKKYMEMNEKEAESFKKTTLSQEVLQAAGCSEETIRKILQEKNDRCQCRCLRQYRKEILKSSTGSRKTHQCGLSLYQSGEKQQEKS